MDKQCLYNALSLSNKLKEKCVMTCKSIVTKWNVYYRGIHCLWKLDTSVDNLSNMEPYAPEHSAAMMDMFDALEKRSLLQTTTQIKHILTSKELNILAFAIWLINLGPINRMCIALMITLLEHTGLRLCKLLCRAESS